MSDFPAEFVVHNQSELEDLAWELEASAGQFSLLLARCNYVNLREQLVESLRGLSPLEIRVLVLQASETALYTRIQAELEDPLPGALMVFGLETVNHLEQLLSTANQVREEFRKNCPFPVVLWTTDSVQRVLVNAASDLESWATKTHFTLPPEALHQGLQQADERLFSTLLNSETDRTFDIKHSSLDLGLLKPSEVILALQELQDQGQRLESRLEAGLNFIRGLQAEDPTEALACFQLSLQFWQQRQTLAGSEQTALDLRKGLLLFFIAQAQYAIASSAPTADRSAVKHSLQEAIALFTQAARPDQVMRCIPLMERVLQKLSAWDDLELIAKQGIDLHRRYGNQTRLSQDYGFWAKAALERQQWPAAQQAAQQALVELANTSDDLPWLRGLYLLFWAQAERQLGNSEGAIAHLLEANAGAVSDAGYPKFAIEILDALRSLYFERGQYLEAFQAKQERLSIEQQYGIRAFVGAGRLQPRRQKVVAEFQSPTLATVAAEIEAAGRQQDLTRLIERIGRNDRKLIVIHGNSGVGKSSLVNAGLVPALRQKAIGIYENLPIVMRQYTHWAVTLEQALLEAIAEKTGQGTAEAHQNHADAIDGIFQQLQENEQRNLRTVLIFDQFEEFFFVQTDPAMRLVFFQFLGQCLQTTAEISRVKVVLSLREDYLHYLLELNRLPAMEQTGIDLLSRNVLYELGNFSPRDAHTTIQSLTKRANFPLEPALIDRLVEDLSQETGTVRPIELQVVGAQLQEENITTLAQYRKSGTKRDLVKRYLSGVVNDCGADNQNLAELMLYLLTDERGTRPLKTRAELERDLAALKVSIEFEPLDLVRHILVASGLVVLVPEIPDDRYQLVHDYIASFVRQQQTPQLEKLVADLEAERQLRQQAEVALVTLEDQKQKAEAELEGLKTQQDLAKQELTVISRTAKRRIIVSTVSVVVAVATAASAAVGIRSAHRERELALAGTKLERIAVSALRRFHFQQTESLLDATYAGYRLRTFVQTNHIKALQDYPALSPLLALQTSLDNIQETKLEGHQGSVEDVTFSPDGQRLATSGKDGIARLWNLQGQEIAKLEGHQGSVEDVTFSPDGQRLATSGKDGIARLWNLQGQEIVKLEGHQGSVENVTFSPDGQRLATSGKNGTARLWNLQGKQLAVLEGHQGDVENVAFSPDGQRLATSGKDGTARLWNLQGKQLAVLEGHQGDVENVTFSPDSQRLATGGGDGTARLWNLQGKQLAVLEGYQGDVENVAFSPDGQRLATGGEDGAARLWNLNGREIVKLEGHQGDVETVAFSPDGQRLATGGEDGTVKTWNLQGKQLAKLEGYQRDVENVTFSPDNQRLATSGSDGTARLWNLQGKQLAKLEGHQRDVETVAFSPDGQRVATSGDDGTARLWDLQGQELVKLEGHQGSVLAVTFSPDGQQLATSGSDGTVRLWDLQGQELVKLEGHQGPVWAVAFSPDGQRLATGESDKTARLWNLQGQEIAKFEGHQGFVDAVAFSPDGQRLATSGADRTTRLWNLQGQQIAQYEGRLGAFNQDWSRVAIVQPSNPLLSNSKDQIVTLWRIDDLDGLLARACDRLHWYLAYSSRVSDSDRTMCGVTKAPDSTSLKESGG
ncbi:MAG TPA: AAA family ATPase [Leptolyngbyaceae cyanobacterium]